MLRLLFHSLKWLALLLPMAAAVGSASAFFLWSLDAVTRVRFSNGWLLYLLPLGGLIVGLIYQAYGKSVTAGNNLLLDEIHQPGVGVPRRMAPLILLGTLVTHLFGGSAGREGTALQMGGGIAAAFARYFKPGPEGVRILLMAGVAAGFGSVFGTPVAGAVFAIEVLVAGRMQYDALVPCFIAAVVADWTCHAWGAHHMHYHVVVADAGLRESILLLLKVAVAGVLFGLCGRLFCMLTHGATEIFRRRISLPVLRPVAGGIMVIALVFIAGTQDYLGLGVLGDRGGAITLPAMFTSTEIPATAWLWKMAFTVITLASGFKGGEVTPLFFIGAALGNALAWLLGAPVDLFAALGFVAIFAAATKTPIASTLLGIELFGANIALPVAAACVAAYLVSGGRGIYSSQRQSTPKFRGGNGHK